MLMQLDFTEKMRIYSCNECKAVFFFIDDVDEHKSQTNHQDIMPAPDGEPDAFGGNWPHAQYPCRSNLWSCKLGQLANWLSHFSHSQVPVS